MPNYTIDVFWRRRLPTARPQDVQLVRGWSIELEGMQAFQEAPLTLSTELNEGDPLRSGLLLVSAPGAVGKSTLARQIAFATGAVYLDLAKADPVGGNTISGGLVRSGLYPAWQTQTMTVLVDGLDEARMRVTQEAFEAFLHDIAVLSKGREIPIVLFGRSGAIQDSWLLLEGDGVETAVLEIGYYGPEAAVDFALARIPDERSTGSQAIERRAVELLLTRLRAQTETDGDRFAGYAPVLQAVAERVARETNPGALIAQIEKGTQPITLKGVALSILNRERGKLDPLDFEDPQIKHQLYLPPEQLDRLVARVYGLQPPGLPAMSSADAQTYSNALSTWLLDHPFLGGGQGKTSAVFDAMIILKALSSPLATDAALQRELSRGVAANPFLSEFYLPDAAMSGRVDIPAEHIGIVYASLRARLSLGDTASLLVEGPEDAADEEILRAEVEITLARRNDMERPRVLLFDTEQIGTLYLGAYIEDADVTVPQGRVDIGPGPSAVLVAPINIQCQKLVLRAETLIVESAVGASDGAVYLEAENFDGPQLMSVPIVRGSVSFSVSWPGASIFPWTSFATDPTPVDDPRVDEALRRFRKFLTAFRSHSRGSLARLRHKIEHARMTKGAGQAVLSQMIAEGVLTLNGKMYFLDPDRLGRQTEAAYGDVMARRFSPKTIDFVKRALARGA